MYGLKNFKVELINKEEVKDFVKKHGEFAAICYSSDTKYAEQIGRSCLHSGHLSGSRGDYFKFKITNVPRDMIDQLITVFKVVEKASIFIVVALVVVTAFLIGNTIKLAIFSRKREIEIMRLVGASNFSIKQPFVIEGFCLGFIGALIPIAATLYGYSALYKHFNGQLFSPFVKLVPAEPFIYWVSLILLGLGVVVGMFGSYRAVRKYLKI